MFDPQRTNFPKLFVKIRENQIKEEVNQNQQSSSEGTSSKEIENFVKSQSDLCISGTFFPKKSYNPLQYQSPGFKEIIRRKKKRNTVAVRCVYKVSKIKEIQSKNMQNNQLYQNINHLSSNINKPQMHKNEISSHAIFMNVATFLKNYSDEIFIFGIFLAIMLSLIFKNVKFLP